MLVFGHVSLIELCVAVDVDADSDGGEASGDHEILEDDDIAVLSTAEDNSTDNITGLF